MTLSELLDLYSNTPYVADIVSLQRQNDRSKVHWQGLKGSLKALLGAAIFRKHASPQLYILNDRESAQYFQNDLQTFLDKKNITLFISPFRREADLEEPDSWAVVQRTELLTHLKDNKKGQHIIVTYPEALYEKVVDPETLKNNTFEITVGDKLDMDFLIEFMVQYGFERTYFVHEAGTFSIRGGILDIFSFGNDLPFRIQLDEDKVESIRVFDQHTQLSIKKMHHINLVPNLEGRANADRISFFNYLATNTLVFIQDVNYTEEVTAALQKKMQEYLNSGAESAQNLIESYFLTPEEVIKGIDLFTVVEWGTRFHFDPDKTNEFEVLPQPEFNRNFNLLADTLHNNNRKRITNLVFSDQAKQVERIYAIFEDLKVKAEFVPVYQTLHEGFIDKAQKLACFTEHQIFGRYQRYKGKRGYSKTQSLTLKELYELKPGDFVTHIDHGVGIFSGLEKVEVNDKLQEAIRLKYKGGDLLYVNIHSLHKIARYVGQEGHPPKMNKLGTNTWENLKNKTKKQVKDIARDLIKLYAARKAQKGFAYAPDTYLQTELEASFIYEDTPDQARTTEDVKRDMQEPHPMDRLVCGDVGFGKTEIAIRAAFKAATEGKQVAILVPTTVLALQHSKTFNKRLEDFPVTVDFISRFKTAQQQKEVLKKVEAGKIDILIGTHRILSKDLKFKDLGLLIIDEEQKFGVAAKEKLRLLKTNVDTLTLTATPIPRTLQFSLMGARDLSIINTPPPNRQPVDTRISIFSKELIQQAIEKEIARDGQVFFVHNRIKDIFEMGDMMKALCPHARVAVAHAQMEPKKLEEIMVAFVDGFYDVLVSTNIIESGLDIPNANTIIINAAQNFGLSDLYQLRGRVGRSNRKAYCYLLTPPLTAVTPDA
ncbi:MAG: DEAD/DEAH box helicase, partial [Bacteroidota bacterium]|nr:DEAD/DEAH box helicase [Bacteroidota bacterium]